jgi:hypothetical protein
MEETSEEKTAAKTSTWFALRNPIDKLRRLRTDPNPPEEWISLSVEKEVLNRRVRTGGLPPDYIDQ